MPELYSYETPDENQVVMQASVERQIPQTPPPVNPDNINEQIDEQEVDPSTELFEGGPTKAQIDEWKKQYKKIYVTEVADEKYILWRPLLRAEYRNLVAEMEKLVERGMSNSEATMNNEEAITRLCTIWPANVTAQSLATDLAGMPSIISQQIMEASGFLSLQVREL